MAQVIRLLVLCVVVGLLGGCERGATDPAPPSDGRIKVVCTTTMIADVAQQIAGDLAEIQGIMKVGEDPHVYDVRPRDAQMIAAADVVLMNGLHLEATLAHVIENNTARARVARLAETPGIEPRASAAAAGVPDPHCWFSVPYFRLYAEKARDTLVEADPKNADAYRRNAEAYLAKLDELHAWVKAQIDAVPRERRVLITSHDAFGYFGSTYDIDVFSVIGISTEQAPRPQDVQRLEELARERGVKALFIETSVNATLNELVKKVATLTGVRIGGTLYSDSLGPADSEAGTYIGMVRHNTTTIVEALK